MKTSVAGNEKEKLKIFWEKNRSSFLAKEQKL
jgi:hypothetical protein